MRQSDGRRFFKSPYGGSVVGFPPRRPEGGDHASSGCLPAGLRECPRTRRDRDADRPDVGNSSASPRRDADDTATTFFARSLTAASTTLNVPSPSTSIARRGFGLPAADEAVQNHNFTPLDRPAGSPELVRNVRSDRAGAAGDQCAVTLHRSPRPRNLRLRHETIRSRAGRGRGAGLPALLVLGALNAAGIRDRRVGAFPLWEPHAPDRHRGRSSRHSAILATGASRTPGSPGPPEPLAAPSAHLGAAVPYLRAPAGCALEPRASRGWSIGPLTVLVSLASIAVGRAGSLGSRGGVCVHRAIG
jgi:hypothetical protein